MTIDRRLSVASNIERLLAQHYLETDSIRGAPAAEHVLSVKTATGKPAVTWRRFRQSRRRESLCLLVCAGDPLPHGWRVGSVSPLSTIADLYVPGHTVCATIWLRTARKYFPARVLELERRPSNAANPA